MHAAAMRHGMPENSSALRCKLLKEHRELAEWVKREIASKARKARSTFSKLVDKQRCSMSEAGARAAKEIDALASRQVHRTARLTRKLDRLSECFKNAGQEAFQGQLDACKAKLSKSMRHSSLQLDLIKKVQEQILAREFDRVAKKSSRAIDRNAEHLGTSK